MGCWQKEYDHHETHPLENEHDYHDHNHDHSHDHGEKGAQDLVEEIEDKDRIIWQQPEKVLEMLGEIDGKTIADIGAGTGYFTFRLALESANVLAIDIDPQAIKYIDTTKLKFPEAIQNKIHTRLANENDPQLKPEEADAVILVNTYSYIENRIEYFSNLKKGMKSGAKLLIVDYKKKKLPEGYGAPDELRVAMDSVENELELAGYRLMETDDTTLDYQYIILVTNP